MMFFKLYIISNTSMFLHPTPFCEAYQFKTLYSIPTLVDKDLSDARDKYLRLLFLVKYIEFHTSVFYETGMFKSSPLLNY